MNQTQRLKIYLIRIASLLLVVAYFREWNWIAISSGDFGIGPKVFGLGLAILCNFGLWLATVPIAKSLRVVVLILLLPTLLISPDFLASRYNMVFSSIAFLVMLAAVHNLYQCRLEA
jgi:hypothetical protein